MINKFVFVTIIFVLVVGAIANQNAYEREQTYNIIKNATTVAFVNASSHIPEPSLIIENESITQIVIDVVYKSFHFVVFVMYRIILVTSRFAVDNPQFNYELILKLLVLAIILAVLLPLIRILIIVWIVCYDLIRHYKEKKEIKRLRKLKEEEDASNKSR